MPFQSSNLDPNSPEFHRLEDLKQRLSLWRRTPMVGIRCIPDELWQAAADLARDLSPYVVSRTLGLEYAKLRRKMGNQDPCPKRNRPHHPFAPPAAPSTLRLKRNARTRSPAGQHPDSIVAGFLEATIVPGMPPSQNPVLLAEVIRPQGDILRVFSATAGDLVRAFLQP